MVSYWILIFMWWASFLILCHKFYKGAPVILRPKDLPVAVIFIMFEALLFGVVLSSHFSLFGLFVALGWVSRNIYGLYDMSIGKTVRRAGMLVAMFFSILFISALTFFVYTSPL